MLQCIKKYIITKLFLFQEFLLEAVWIWNIVLIELNRKIVQSLHRCQKDTWPKKLKKNAKAKARLVN